MPSSRQPDEGIANKIPVFRKCMPITALLVKGKTFLGIKIMRDGYSTSNCQYINTYRTNLSAYNFWRKQDLKFIVLIYSLLLCLWC